MMHALRWLLILVRILKREEIIIYQNHCKYNLRKHFFTFFANRIVAIWESLPGYVVDANSTNIFKNHLDNHWCIQDIMYDSESEQFRVTMLVKSLHIKIIEMRL